MQGTDIPWPVCKLGNRVNINSVSHWLQLQFSVDWMQIVSLALGYAY